MGMSLARFHIQMISESNHAGTHALNHKMPQCILHVQASVLGRDLREQWALDIQWKKVCKSSLGPVAWLPGRVSWDNVNLHQPPRKQLSWSFLCSWEFCNGFWSGAGKKEQRRHRVWKTNCLFLSLTWNASQSFISFPSELEWASQIVQLFVLHRAEAQHGQKVQSQDLTATRTILRLTDLDW